MPKNLDLEVALCGVTKTYARGITALAGVNLEIRRGEWVSLLGPSGCGKSTVLRLIAGLSAPSQGTVLGGLEPGAADRRLGLVFQEPTLMPWATVRGNVMIPLRLLGVPSREARARGQEVLAQVGLEGFADAYPRELSGGMKMRVALARALVARPQLLLLDEPFAALDEITRGKLNDDLLTLWQAQGLTVVFVTHSVFESVYLSTRIAVFSPRPGRVVAEFPIDAPFPRGPAFRLSADYQRRCQAVSAQLAAAMEGDPR